MLIALSAYFAIAAGEILESSIHKVAVFGDPDRRTESQFAKENGLSLKAVQRRYAATGLLICGRGRGTVNLVVANDLVVTSAHMFTDRKTCKSIIAPTQCTVEFKTEGATVTRRLAKLEATGLKCPGVPLVKDDWAIARLNAGAPNIKPYSAPINDADRNVSLAANVTFVGAMSADFGREIRRGKPVYPKHIGKCRIEGILAGPYDQGVLVSDCDTSRGASGGAVLNDAGDEPLLVGLHQGSTESPDQVLQAIARGVPNSGPYRRVIWEAYHLPLRGEFLRALIKVGGNSKEN